MIVYDPFWRTLKGRGISTYKMINKLGYSSGTLYRLRHNKGISSRLIDCSATKFLRNSDSENEKK